MTLHTNAFLSRTDQPTEAELAAAIGSARKVLWDRLLANLAEEFGTDVQEWHCYSVKAGWSMRVKRAKRTILYMIPCQGCFSVALVLGDKAVQAAKTSGLPQRVLDELASAKRYAEGTGIRVDVKSARDLAVVRKLAKIKAEN